MAEYYCLMAGAPDLTPDGSAETTLSVEDFWSQCEESLTPRDLRLVSVFFLQQDCRNLVRLLQDPEADIVQPAGMSRDSLLELILSAREMYCNVEDYPAFMQDFVRDFDAHADDADFRPTDQVLLRFYEQTDRCHNRMIAEWYRWNFRVTNLLTALIARKQGWNAGDFILGNDEVNEMIRTKQTKDFDLSKLYDFAAEVIRVAETSDPVEKERFMDALRWRWLDDATEGNAFGVEAVFAYLCKLDMLARWRRLDPEQGKATFTRIIESLRSAARVPEEFVLKNVVRK